MTRNSRPILVLGTLVAIMGVACAGTHPPPQFAYDHEATFAGLTTWAWYDDPTFKMPHGDSIIDGAFLDGHIRSAIDDGLRKRGYQKVSAASASMYVAYRTGDSGVASEDKDPNYEWLTGYNVATVYEKERTITIDIRDQTKKLVWRGSITRLEGENPDAVGRALDREIGTLLDKFPPQS